MDKTYNHKLTEDAIYEKWGKSGAFAPINSPEAKSFTIIMPPPNANDPLHIGHAMFVTVEDILIRYHRMLGEAALWLPGTDHAGIETQYVFEKKLKKDGKSRFDFDRQTLYQMIWDYVQKNSDTAVDQLKKLGASADWSRFTFTLDPKIISIVITTFKTLHEQGLIYRDLRLINYCTRCGTGYSELEAKHVEQTDPLYFMKYGPFTLATVRPETKFGDTALAVNPKDKRYQKYIGKTVEAEGLLGKFAIKVIADDYIDPQFGTGIAKVTPLHDFNDYEIWQRHKEEMPEPKQVINFNGKLTDIAGPYAGLSVLDARKKVAEDLQQKGLLTKVDTNYLHTLSVCYRCGRVLEPLPLPQFFLKVKPMTEKALHALAAGKVKIHGAGHDKILKHWLENLKDWNISRQIVWGIRLPVWYSVEKNPNLEIAFLSVIPAQAEIQKNIDSRFRGNDNSPQLVHGKVAELLKNYSLEEIKTGLQSLKAPVEAEYIISSENPGNNFIQETDTFDTWFSSGQWPFATLLRNSKFQISNFKFESLDSESDFNKFYPTQVMETAYDILPFWVMRMLMLGIHMTGKVPFEQVYFHGLVRDEKGQKMSKSKGNVINPLDFVEKYGADSLRMALVMSTTAGQDSNTGESKIRGMRNFTNKIWNAARYVILASEERARPESILESAPPPQNDDQAFNEKLNQITTKVTQQLNDLKIGLAAETVYNEFWHWFCDEAIEQAKKGEISITALTEGLKTFLKLLHPFVPFVTEAVWEKLDTKTMLISESWPQSIKRP